MTEDMKRGKTEDRKGDREGNKAEDRTEEKTGQKTRRRTTCSSFTIPDPELANLTLVRYSLKEG